jgi:predicted RNA-binding protein with PUA domain
MTDEPNLITSGKSQRVVVDGYIFDIQIYRLETEKTWTLEVVDHEGTSHVWDESIATDRDARNAALEALEREGAVAFMRGNNVVPLRPS